MMEEKNTSLNFMRTSRGISLIAFAFLVLGFFVGFLLEDGIKESSTLVHSSTETLSLPTPTLSAKVLTDPQFKTASYTPTQVDMSKPFFDPEPYPSVLKNIPDSQLTSMRCTYDIHREGNGKGTRYYYLKNDAMGGNSADEITVKDPSFYEALVLEASGAVLHNPFNQVLIRFCDGYATPNTTNRYVFFSTGGSYEIDRVYGGAGQSEFNLTPLYVGNETYEDCNFPLALTTSGIMYYACFGGDTRSHGQIFTLDTHADTKKPIYDCVSGAPGPTIKPATCTANPL